MASARRRQRFPLLQTQPSCGHERGGPTSRRDPSLPTRNPKLETIETSCPNLNPRTLQARPPPVCCLSCLLQSSTTSAPFIRGSTSSLLRRCGWNRSSNHSPAVSPNTRSTSGPLLTGRVDVKNKAIVDAHPRPGHFRCGGRKSNFQADCGSAMALTAALEIHALRSSASR
jgi:hypothetical protein